jgi:hypothetical protein
LRPSDSPQEFFFDQGQTHRAEKKKEADMLTRASFLLVAAAVYCHGFSVAPLTYSASNAARSIATSGKTATHGLLGLKTTAKFRLSQGLRMADGKKDE